MPDTILTILSAILGLLGGIVERRYSKEAVKERDDYERDKELASQDSPAIGRRLSDLHDKLRKKNYRNSKR